MTVPAKGSAARPKVLHLHSTFAAGGKELRAVQLMNAFGDALDHTVVSGQPEHKAAREYIARGVPVQFPEDFPSLTGFPGPARLAALARAMKRYDLVLTYNWGAMDAVMAHAVFGEAFKLPPLIHHEDGFNQDEALQLKAPRNWYRRIALGRAYALVVPSTVLEGIAQSVWNQPRTRIRRIANGIDTAKFGGQPQPGAFRVVKREGERWIGTIAGLRAVKQLPMLVKACANLPEYWHLVILGEGPEREAIMAAASALDINDRVHLPGAIRNPASVIGLFDIFALSSQSEQFPLSVVEAMAAGLPIAAPDVGDIKVMVADPNRPYIAVRGDPEALAVMLEELTADGALRAELGRANRDKARAHFDHSHMIAAYRSLYAEALRRDF
ncbi:glycosyltransferase [Qipengyuania sp. ASV99]|uniref:glycosyltransferase n=1 Tax=Qipengyuania sp. ASV99 TaxID=3399681 RepID=UPI003A4C5A38